jgi:hypothetical protein
VKAGCERLKLLTSSSDFGKHSSTKFIFLFFRKSDPGQRFFGMAKPLFRNCEVLMTGD